MRISDWSSDVCSSDLKASGRRQRADRVKRRLRRWKLCEALQPDRVGDHQMVERAHDRTEERTAVARQLLGRQRTRRSVEALRSEEHTSELQSLMRNSYAVFCLKKKTKDNKPIPHIKTQTR